MKISTKGRYALRVMVDLAERNTQRFTPLKDIAERQEISQKYLESIMTMLSKEGLVEAQHGKGGGYRQKHPASECTVASVLRATEDSLAPVACLETEENLCPRARNCKTLPLWMELDFLVNSYLECVTIEDLAKRTAGGEYSI